MTSVTISPFLLAPFPCVHTSQDALSKGRAMQGEASALCPKSLTLDLSPNSLKLSHKGQAPEKNFIIMKGQSINTEIGRGGLLLPRGENPERGEGEAELPAPCDLLSVVVALRLTVAASSADPSHLLSFRAGTLSCFCSFVFNSYLSVIPRPSLCALNIGASRRHPCHLFALKALHPEHARLSVTPVLPPLRGLCPRLWTRTCTR